MRPRGRRPSLPKGPPPYSIGRRSNLGEPSSGGFGLSGSIGFLRSASCALGGGSLRAFGLGDGGGGGARVASALSSFGSSGTFISSGRGGISGFSSCAVCSGWAGAGSGLGGSWVAIGVEESIRRFSAGVGVVSGG